MKKTILTLLAAGSLLLAASPAYAADYTQEAADGLKGANTVYADSNATLSSADTIQSALNGTGIDVAALPPLAVETYSPTAVASDIRVKTGADTVIVIIDEPAQDKIGVSSKHHQAEIQEAIYKAMNDHNGDGGLALADTIATVKQLSGDSTPTAPTNPTPDVGSGGILTILLPIILVIAAGGGITAYVMKKRRKAVEATAKRREIEAGFNKDVSPSLFPLVGQLRQLIPAHQSLGEHSLAPEIQQLVENLNQLVQRLQKLPDNSQKILAEVEYENKLPKLISALGNEYYVDIASNLTLWDKPEERLDAVKSAVTDVHQELLTNIRKVNSSQDLEFRVKLNSLAAPKTISLDDLLNQKDD